MDDPSCPREDQKRAFHKQVILREIMSHVEGVIRTDNSVIYIFETEGQAEALRAYMAQEFNLTPAELVAQSALEEVSKN